MADDLESKIGAWLERTGFPLEMRVAAALRERGLGVAQGTYYADPRQPETHREIDVVVGQRLKDRHDVQAHVAIECKTTTQPWVVFSGPRRPRYPEGAGAGVHSSPKARAIVDGPGFPSLTSLPSERVGYGLRATQLDSERTRENDRDPAYTAVSQVLSFAASVTHEAFRLPDGQRPDRRVALPCVVLDGLLFEAYLPARGKLKIEPVHRAVLEWGQFPTAWGFATVHVVTVDKLDEFADGVKAWMSDVVPRLNFN